MNPVTLFNLLKSLMLAAFSHRNDPSHWEGWIDVHGSDDQPKEIQLKGKFKSASVEVTGLKFEIDVEGKTVTLEARADISNIHKLSVYVDDILQPEASVVVAPKSSPAHPIRVAVDFRPISLNGDETRFNLRFNG